jgi:hypothetical protein
LFLTAFHTATLDLIVQVYYSESLYASRSLLRLLCWGVSKAFCYAGCFATLGRTLKYIVKIIVVVLRVVAAQACWWWRKVADSLGWPTRMGNTLNVNI